MTTLRKSIGLAATLICVSLQAQQVQSHILNWSAQEPSSERAAVLTKNLTFPGARFDHERQDLPFFQENIQLKGNVADFDVVWLSATYEPIVSSEREVLLGLGEPNCSIGG